MLYLIKSLIRALLLVVVIAIRIVIATAKIILKVIFSIFAFIKLLFAKRVSKSNRITVNWDTMPKL